MFSEKWSREDRSGWPLNRLLHSERLNLFSPPILPPRQIFRLGTNLLGCNKSWMSRLACCTKGKEGDSPEACSISLLLSLKQGNSCHYKNFMFETIKSIIYKAINWDLGAYITNTFYDIPLSIPIIPQLTRKLRLSGEIAKRGRKGAGERLQGFSGRPVALCTAIKEGGGWADSRDTFCSVAAEGYPTHLPLYTVLIWQQLSPWGKDGWI